MKKLIALLLCLSFLFSLAACGGNTESEPESSTPVSSEEESIEGGMEIPYSATMDGYIDHNGKWEIDYKVFGGWECMTDEMLFLPAGTTVLCNQKLAIYCYRVGIDSVLYDMDACKELGQEITAQYDVKAAPCSLVLEKDYLVRFSVKGKLTDVCVFGPPEVEEEIRLITEEEAIAEQDPRFK